MSKSKAILVLFLAAIVWGFAFVAQRVGGENVGAFAFTSIRFFIGSLSLLPVIYLFEKKGSEEKAKNSRKYGILCGIVLFAAVIFQHYGVMQTDFAGKSGFITDFYIILVPILKIFVRRKTPLQAWIGACLALIGFYFLCLNGNTITINQGDVLLFVGAIFFALHISIVDAYANVFYSLRLSFYQFLTCSLLAGIGTLCFETVQLSALQEAAIPILYGGIASVGIGYTLQIVGQQGCDSTTSAIILSSEAVFCALGSMLLLNEIMSLTGYIGCLLVFIGIIVAQLPSKQKQL